jgi:hypothetical protein
MPLVLLVKTVHLLVVLVARDQLQAFQVRLRGMVLEAVVAVMLQLEPVLVVVEQIQVAWVAVKRFSRQLLVVLILVLAVEAEAIQVAQLHQQAHNQEVLVE